MCGAQNRNAEDFFLIVYFNLSQGQTMPKGKKSQTPQMLCSREFRLKAQKYMPLTEVNRPVLRALYIQMFGLIGMNPPPPPSPSPPSKPSDVLIFF
jgi:hypothetical protein